jgi:vacuolar-type H+-ATPase subunit F/Vma7
VKIFILGERRDVRGFALAGIEGRVCRNRLEAESALRDVLDKKDVGLLLLSSSVDRLASLAVRSLTERRETPIVLVLPEKESPADSSGRPR